MSLALFASSISAHAAAISWSAAAQIVNESVIQSNVSSAFNLSNENTTYTVSTGGQDVAFVSTSTGSITSNGVTLTMISNFNSGIQQLGFWNGTVLSDADFNSVMDSFAHGGSGAATTGSFELSGLTPGTQYSVQIFASDTRSGQVNRTIRYDDGAGNQTTLETQGSKPYFIGTFTADASIQNFNAFSDTSQGASSGSPILNALTLAVVPEPGSVGLMCLGGLVLLARRRRP